MHIFVYILKQNGQFKFFLNISLREIPKDFQRQNGLLHIYLVGSNPIHRHNFNV